VLKKRVLSLLENYAPGLKDRITSGFVITPDDFHDRYGDDTSHANFLERLLVSYGERVRTPIRGLYLCGVDAEPVNAITGRAGRAAASLALKELDEGGAARDE
jgi:phytoene dehydrogenase-like protein